MHVSRRDVLIDALGLGALLLLLGAQLAPALILSSTLPAGGDTPGHYPTAVLLAQTLLPQGRLHGWNPTGLLGHPLPLYYFPLPFALMAALAPLLGLPVAFKLVMAAGGLLLPLGAYVALRLTGLRFPTPLFGACAAAVFLCVDENPIWGGTLASLLAGEFSYAWGLLFALLFLGAAYRAYSRGRSALVPALLLALTALSHGYAVCWAGASATFFLYASRRPGRTLRWLLAVAGLGFALAAFFLVPLLADWAWTTPYADPWIEVGARQIAPPLLLPLFALTLGALGFIVVDWRRAGGPDQRVLWLLHAALAAALLAVVAPVFGVIDVRLLPFAQLALALVGATALGRVCAAPEVNSGAAIERGAPGPHAAPEVNSGAAIERGAPAPRAPGPGVAAEVNSGAAIERGAPAPRAPGPHAAPEDPRASGHARGAATLLWAVVFVALTLVTVQTRSRTVRAWARWDFSGLESKPLWPAFERLAAGLKGGPADPRVALESSDEWGRGGSTRLGDLLPLVAGRSTLDGLYSQASLHAPAVYYLASELYPRAPNPHRSLEYSSFDPATALQRLRLFNVREIVALSPELRAALATRPELEHVSALAPFDVFRLRDPGPGYVEPLAFAPVRSPRAGWRDKAYRWLLRKPPARAALVFTDDARFAVVERDAWLAPPEVPLPGAGDVRVESRLSAEALEVRTSRPGQPLLVKLSYHPRWRVTGADGPYLVSPAMMLIIPTQAHVRLFYAAHTWADALGRLLTLAGLAVAALLAWRAWRGVVPRPKPFRPKRVGADGLPLPTRRWGAAVPLTLALLLLVARVVPAGPSRAEEGRELARRARSAYAAARYDDAAEYARHALARLTDQGERRRLQELREQSWHAAGR